MPKALAREGVEPRYADTSPADGYAQLLIAYWAKGETFIVLEQDKIPSPGALRELWECEQPWCVFPVPMRDTDQISPYPSLACAKFDESLMRWLPDLMKNACELDLGFGEGEWSRLDLAVSGLLEPLCPAHWHEAGKVEHLH